MIRLTFRDDLSGSTLARVSRSLAWKKVMNKLIGIRIMAYKIFAQSQFIWSSSRRACTVHSSTYFQEPWEPLESIKALMYSQGRVHKYNRVQGFALISSIQNMKFLPLCNSYVYWHANSSQASRFKSVFLKLWSAAVRQVVRDGPHAVSKGKAFQKLYRTLILRQYISVLKLPLLVDKQKAGELLISITSWPSTAVSENTLN